MVMKSLCTRTQQGHKATSTQTLGCLWLGADGGSPPKEAEEDGGCCALQRSAVVPPHAYACTPSFSNRFPLTPCQA